MRILAFISLVASTTAWTTGSCVSSFGGNVLVTGKCEPSTEASLTMKKGKANVPPQMRSQYKRQQELQSMREQMVAAQTVGDDGLPVFNLFVRTKKANVSRELNQKERSLGWLSCSIKCAHICLIDVVSLW